MFRRLTPSQIVVDIAIATLGVLLRSAVIGYTTAAMPLVVLGMGAALALRRVSPGVALVIAWIFALGQMLSRQSPDISNVAILAVLYTTARYGQGWVKWAGLVSAVTGAFVSTAYAVLTPYTGLLGSGRGLVWSMIPSALFSAAIGLTAALAVLGLSWTAGLLVRTRVNARESRLSQIAAEQVVIVEQERNRIARDMHDVVAHSLAVVIAQADGARYARATNPDAIDDTLTTISSTAREALADVRVLLGQLRHHQDAGPQPALADLDRLVEQLRSSGLLVELEERGDPLILPAGKQLALYRIVQEALTNALRHGDVEREVTVLIDWSVDAATLTISNTLAASAADIHAGHGLAGMRERALLVGGTSTAGQEGGAFVVRARIPATVTA